jgi:hypothetical protein
MPNDNELMAAVTKKRKHTENTMKNDDEMTEMLSQTNDSGFAKWCTVENMLAIPIEYVFRDVSMISTDVSVGWSPATPRSNTILTKNKTNETTNHRTKPLLSRIEAQLFLQVNTLSYEMDALTSTSVLALQQRVQCRELSTSLQRADHPYLRPIVSILHTYHETMPSATIQHVSTVMTNRIVPEFQRLLHQLRQFSEQNWTLADTLDDGQPEMGGYHNILAHEKRKLSDLQEEICQRIEGLLQTSLSESQQALAYDEMAETCIEPLSMKEYCDQLFEQPNDLPAIENSEIAMDVVVNSDVNQTEVTCRAETTDENDDDEEIEEAPDRSLTATPISSPEESPTMIQATTAARASILRNVTTTASSPLVAFATTHATRTTTSTPHDPSAEHDTTQLQNTTPITIQHPQRQLEKSFGSPTAAEETLEENEKENEPSQSSSQRSAMSVNTTQTVTVKRQRLQCHQTTSETLPPQSSTTMLSELDPSHSMDSMKCDDTGGNGDRPDAFEPQGRTTFTTRSDDDDDEHEERQIFEEKECFRTQNAAEVLSSLATTTLGLSPLE